MPAFTAVLRVGNELLPPLEVINRVYHYLATVTLGSLAAFADEVQVSRYPVSCPCTSPCGSRSHTRLLAKLMSSDAI